MLDIVEGIEDPSVLTAMHTLINPENVDTKLDLEDIERQLIGTNIAVDDEPIDPSEAFKSMMQEFTKNIESDSTNVGMRSGFEMYEDPSLISTPVPAPTSAPTPAPASTPAYVSTFDPTTADMKVGYPNPYEVEQISTSYISRPKSELDRMTEEQKDQRQIDYVLHKMDGGDSMSSSFEKEREKEEKIRMLDEIDAIRSEMRYEKIDTSGVPDVNINNSYSEIENTLRILRYKYDRKRYCSLAEDVIMAGAHGAEYLFDGRKKYGPYSPDLTDWHNTVRVKLRRMRYETSTIVSNIMTEYNIGPTWRIMLELIPSAFLHSRMRSRGRNDHIPTEEEMQQAMGEIRDHEL